MTEQLKEMGGRLAGLRQIMDYTSATFAKALGVSDAELAAYERGERDFSFSFLYNAAELLGVDVVELISGQSPRLNTLSLVRNGEGLSVERNKSYIYKHLAFTFRNKLAEPFLVTVEPKGGESPAPHSHEGQEFNYLLSGRMAFHIDEIVHELNPGDSIYFDSSKPHAVHALDESPATFIALVMGHENH
ncbi:MAG: XRE family transcriptional regulator [Oscillospiraceae bacterium]|jgi:mannose-6-phosphate isomerase-like protein (cupin superfamily)/DNA-binding XRE family transcriptional regulator|nr:XRE family transcriptional regulator [Oscillospiraceae bacterium]